MNIAGAVGGAFAGIVVAVWSYAALCALALVPVAAIAVLMVVLTRGSRRA